MELIITITHSHKNQYSIGSEKVEAYERVQIFKLGRIFINLANKTVPTTIKIIIVGQGRRNNMAQLRRCTNNFTNSIS